MAANFLRRCTATSVAASRRFNLSAAARSFSASPSQHDSAEAKTVDPLEDLPNEEYCSISLGGYIIGLPTNTVSQTVRFLINHGTRDLFQLATPDYPLQSSGPKQRCEARKVDEGLFVRIDVPGVSKEELMIWTEKNKVRIVGDGSRVTKYDSYGRRHNAEIELCPNANLSYDIEKIKADLKRGVLRLVIPKKSVDDNHL